MTGQPCHKGDVGKLGPKRSSRLGDTRPQSETSSNPQPYARPMSLEATSKQFDFGSPLSFAPLEAITERQTEPHSFKWTDVENLYSLHGPTKSGSDCPSVFTLLHLPEEKGRGSRSDPWMIYGLEHRVSCGLVVRAACSYESILQYAPSEVQTGRRVRLGRGPPGVLSLVNGCGTGQLEDALS